MKKHYHKGVHVYNTGKDKDALRKIMQQTAGKDSWIFQFVKYADETSPFFSVKKALSFANKHAKKLKEDGFSTWSAEQQSQKKQAIIQRGTM